MDATRSIALRERSRNTAMTELVAGSNAALLTASSGQTWKSAAARRGRQEAGGSSRSRAPSSAGLAAAPLRRVVAHRVISPLPSVILPGDIAINRDRWLMSEKELVEALIEVGRSLDQHRRGPEPLDDEPHHARACGTVMSHWNSIGKKRWTSAWLEAQLRTPALASFSSERKTSPPQAAGRGGACS